MADLILLEPVPVRVTRYRCLFCPRTRSAKNAARAHIARCWLNPAARACKTCANFTDEPDGGWCLPGRQCEAGVTDVADGTIMSGCALWKLRENDDG